MLLLVMLHKRDGLGREGGRREGGFKGQETEGDLDPVKSRGGEQRRGEALTASTYTHAHTHTHTQEDEKTANFTCTAHNT